MKRISKLRVRRSLVEIIQSLKAIRKEFSIKDRRLVSVLDQSIEEMQKVLNDLGRESAESKFDDLIALTKILSHFVDLGIDWFNTLSYKFGCFVAA